MVAADPTLWAAKFNLADLPFSYRNYTEARRRFESLTAETDRAREPRQVELTEFKVFLTLLLEGRESAARSFMARFKPNGVTPAHPYAQAAMDFHAGRFDRAIESMKEARKDYPPQLEAIFAESFYRVGWLTDATTSTAAAAVAAAPAPTPPAALSPAVAQTSPSAATVPTVPSTSEPSSSDASSSSPAPEPTPAVAAVATPAPPEPTAPAVVIAPPVPEPTPSVPPTPTTVATVAAAPDGVTETPGPSASPVLAPATRPEPASTVGDKTTGPSLAETLVRKVLPVLVGLYLVGTLAFAARVFLARRQHQRRARRTVPFPRYPTAEQVAESEKV